MTPVTKCAFSLKLFCLSMLAALAFAGGVRGQELLEKAEATEALEESIKTSPESFLDENGELDLDAVVKHFEDLYRSTSSISEAELTTIKPRGKRTLRMDVWTKGEEKALIVIQSPPREEGTATLKVGKNLWNYLPKIKRTIRIPPSMMLASWMGSDFTNDDLVRESSFSEDYTYELLGRSEDPKGWLISFNAKPDMVGLWKRLELVVSEDGRIPIEAEYYDRKDRLARTIYWTEVRQFDDRRIPSRLTLVPQDKEGHRTEMVYLDIDFDVEISESMFSLSALEQKR
ncbi:MAG: outer membrane lipoprotein-sorting protein [Candidatus Hydrogenedentota bacterium]|nr:MAG: outer membrane lipoprotein-sorting protein [Candidatus Hydrogenedentota bacterium]